MNWSQYCSRTYTPEVIAIYIDTIIIQERLKYIAGREAAPPRGRSVVSRAERRPPEDPHVRRHREDPPADEGDQGHLREVRQG